MQRDDSYSRLGAFRQKQCSDEARTAVLEDDLPLLESTSAKFALAAGLCRKCAKFRTSRMLRLLRQRHALTWWNADVAMSGALSLSSVMDWSQIAPDFTPDGSLRDIYILGTSMDD